MRRTSAGLPAVPRPPLLSAHRPGQSRPAPGRRLQEVLADVPWQASAHRRRHIRTPQVVLDAPVEDPSADLLVDDVPDTYSLKTGTVFGRRAVRHLWATIPTGHPAGPTPAPDQTVPVTTFSPSWAGDEHAVPVKGRPQPAPSQCARPSLQPPPAARRRPGRPRSPARRRTRPVAPGDQHRPPRPDPRPHQQPALLGTLGGTGRLAWRRRRRTPHRRLHAPAPTRRPEPGVRLPADREPGADAPGTPIRRRGFRVAHRIVEQQIGWLLKQADRHGFTVPAAATTEPAPGLRIDEALPRRPPSL